MAAGAVGDEEQVAGARRVGGGFQRGAAGIGDRARRQAVDDIGVVGRRLRDFAALDRAAQRALAADDAIDDGRVGLQLHLLAQAIDEHRGDAAALVRLAGFLLDDRGQRHQLLRRLDRNVGVAALPDFAQHALLRLLHALDHLVARRAAREFIGLRQQRALARHFAHRTGEDLVVCQTGDDLLGGQAFGNRDGMLHHLALDDGADDVAQIGVLLEQIFAGLQFGAGLEREHRADEHPAAGIDHAFALQLLGDVALAGAGRDVDDLVFREGAGCFQRLPAIDIHAPGPDHRDDDDGDDGVAGDHERVARAVGALRRRRYLLRLQRGARAPR